MIFFFQNFCFLRFFWQENLKQVFMPKIPQKSKFWKKNFISSQFKNTFFCFLNFSRRRPSCTFLRHCRPSCLFLLVDVNHSALFYLVDGQRLLTPINVHFTALFITPLLVRKMIVHHTHHYHNFLSFSTSSWTKNYILKGKRKKKVMIAMTMIAVNDDDN